EPAARRETEFDARCQPCLPKGTEGVGLTTRHVVGKDELLPQVLVQRMINQHLTQDCDRIGYAALQGQSSGVSRPGHNQKFGESEPFRQGVLDVRELEERISPPQAGSPIGEVTRPTELALAEPTGGL